MRRSRRPGRSSAASTQSGRFVAARTTTPCRATRPSISVRSWLRTLSSTLGAPEPASCLAAARPSISSKKTMAGAAARARAKRAATAFSLSPTHLEKSSGPLMAMKLRPASQAQARASSVLLQPGGPYRSTPAGALAPRRSSAPACLNGHSTASRSPCFAACCPPTSSQRTAGTSRVTSRMALGEVTVSAASKSAAVTSAFSGLPVFLAATILRRACSAASSTRDARSAPTNPWVELESLRRSCSSSACRKPLKRIFRISYLP
mmetsp:Transcript_15979/g.37883  ORF Transcript_15979/g.37883 Transcript_15979/m.37883 type:complete len:263 (-) Transcript_15979:1075-1863(-)